jgi:hypothetical protein
VSDATGHPDCDGQCPIGKAWRNSWFDCGAIQYIHLVTTEAPKAELGLRPTDMDSAIRVIDKKTIRRIRGVPIQSSEHGHQWRRRIQ